MDLERLAEAGAGGIKQKYISFDHFRGLSPWGTAFDSHLLEQFAHKFALPAIIRHGAHLDMSVRTLSGRVSAT